MQMASLSNVASQLCCDKIARRAGALNWHRRNYLCFRGSFHKLNVPVNKLGNRTNALLATIPTGQSLAEVNRTLNAQSLAA